MWPFLYFAGDRLSTAELCAARLDGHLVEVGEAFMPADAVETAAMRAGSLREMTRSHHALTHASAAWVHGAIPDPPLVHSLQRATARRTAFPLDVRVDFRDPALPREDVELHGGVAVTTPVRTLVDLVRLQVASDRPDPVVEAMLLWRPALTDAAVAWLEASGPVHHKRPALDELRRRQDVVTR
ncbi:type IV toxin-antitoxin system AbiEi family antitoxin [Microbacterium marinum]|uniref:Uncharacterized protein n=1 Tax=Microbacterium marinum TaxID=421115 RepID=A0A7W7BR67_9MICO|nr:SAM-dependent methyltransferase [Microbacterium marinum]MBB4667331.1 hypothetical protein [Microbacterium marinum]